MYIQKFKPDFLRNYFADLNQICYESFPGIVCFVLYKAKISGEGLQKSSSLEPEGRFQ